MAATIQALVPRMRDICGAGNVITDPLELRTYECDGLAHYRVTPALVVVPEDARQLAKLLSGMKAKVNLIPLNAAAGIPFDRPPDDAIDRFAATLADRGVTVSVRKSRGRDIRAACGQLLVEGQKKSAGQQLAVMM